MNDFIKLIQPLTDRVEKHLLDNNEFKSLCKVNSPTCFYPKGFKSDNIEIKIFPDVVYYEFSLQKLSSGYKRGENFSNDEMKSLLSELQHKYLIDPKESKVINLEIGFTFPELPALRFIQNIVANRAIPKTRDKHLGKGNSGKFRGSSSELKFYDKGMHLDLPFSLFRMEDRLLRSSLIKKLGITCMADLLNPDVQISMLKRFIRTLNLIVIIDEMMLEELDLSERLFIKDCQIPPNWEDTGKFGNHTSRANARRKIRRMHETRGLQLPNKQIIESAYKEYEKFIG
jgi:hypothetical protein